MIRLRFLVSLVLVVTVVSGVFYAQYQAVCALPQTYYIGAVDARFNLSDIEVEQAVATAVATWEDSLERAVFQPTESVAEADLEIHFIFDDRQLRTEAESRERERLAAVEAQSETVQANYTALVEELEGLEQAYEQNAAAYERNLANFNATVATYNAEGGAPPEIFEELENDRQNLERAANQLSADVTEINDLITQINELGEQGNVLISRFNDRAEDFNETFADGREFTQGDYRDGRINIYSFADQAELHVVLVHELGHALDIEHVDAPEAYMHYLLGEQQAFADLHPDDVAGFGTTCSTEARLETVPQPWRAVFAWLQL